MPVAFRFMHEPAAEPDFEPIGLKSKDRQDFEAERG
jgi:hypothetical protein